jgi:hypothetical protein
MNQPTPSTDRFHRYLQILAGCDWGEPTGFAGRTCFQCIPALELERRGEEPGHYRDAWIDHSLSLLQERKDCQDFVMVGLLRLLYRYPQSRLLASRREPVVAALLAAKYDESDPGADTCCWHTENHQVQYASSELLAGQLWPDRLFGCTGRDGAWHRARAAARLRRWLDWRLRFSFSEWNSSCYYDEDLAALLNLVEFADDGGLCAAAARVATLLALHVAGNSWRGLTGTSQGRAYLTQQIAPDEAPMAILAQVAWGDGEVPPRLSLGTVLLAAGDWRLPAVVSRIGRAETLERRERHSLDAAEAAAHGVDPAAAADLPFFLGAGQASHHLVVETRSAATGGREKWPGYWADRDWYRRCRDAGRAFDTWCLPHACGRAELYTFRNPEYMLGCAQAYHPGAPGYQQFIWSATLGRRAVVFTTNPCPADIPYGRPGPWVGNGVLPQVVQHRNVLIALHRVRRVPIYDQPPWYGEERVHAYVPRGAFAEWRERDGWFFGRGEHGGYIGLRPSVPAAWLPPEEAIAGVIGSSEPYEWNVEATDVAWICELGSERTHGSFEAFAMALTAARIAGGVDHLSYDSPSLGRIETGWGRGLRVAGEEVAISGYPLIGDTHFRAPFGQTKGKSSR